MTLKLFMWENVLEDYTSGLVCVLAASEEEAWDEIYKKDPLAWWDLQGSPTRKCKCCKSSSESIKKHTKGMLKTDNVIRPKIVTEPSAFIVWGGG